MTGNPEPAGSTAAEPDAAADAMNEEAVAAFLGREGSLRHAPGPYFGSYGGRWMPESLIAALDELTDTFEKAKADPEFVSGRAPGGRRGAPGGRRGAPGGAGGRDPRVSG